ncbi:MAG TPA: mechanosensitive ion channel family protein [bacterium]
MFGKIIVEIKEIVDAFKDILDVKALLIQLLLYFPKLIAGGMILFIFYGIYRCIRFFLVRKFKRQEVSESVTQLVVKVIRIVMLGLSIILVADQIGIKIIALISTLGVAGIALGLAAQQTLANFISGIILLMSKPFREGDLVELEGTFGRVKEISLRSTALLTMDNILVDIPNQKIVESKIVNHTFNRNIRIRTRIGVAYKTNIPQAQQVLLDLIRNDDHFLIEPAPEVIVVDYADSSIILELQVWLKDSRQEIDLDNEITEKIKAAFDNAGIQIPFPHRQVFIEAIPVNELKEVAMKGVME